MHIFQAIKNNSFKKIIQLLSQAPEESIELVNQFDTRGITPLLCAIEINNLAITKLLLNKGALPNQFNKNQTESPLSLAARKGFMDIVRLLIEQGANLNLGDSKGFTPLMKVLVDKNNNYLEMISYLINKGANLNQSNAEGERPLLLAAYQKDIAATLLLLKRTAEDAPSVHGSSALSIFYQAKHHSNAPHSIHSIFKILVDRRLGIPLAYTRKIFLHLLPRFINNLFLSLKSLLKNLSNAPSYYASLFEQKKPAPIDQDYNTILKEVDSLKQTVQALHLALQRQANNLEDLKINVAEQNKALILSPFKRKDFLNQYPQPLVGTEEKIARSSYEMGNNSSFPGASKGA
ncbi:MAG: ankyrin [Francisellaceae bacterium]|nr:ankyrin [Francisellaceae bacterium]